MFNNQSSASKKIYRFSYLIITSIVFIIAYPFWPQFAGNQNTYLLRGLASANYGLLGSDWLSNTPDLTPVFSTLVNILFSGFGKISFIVVYFIIIGIYIYAIFEILKKIFDRDYLFKPLYVLLFILLHSPVMGEFNRLAGFDFGKLFHTGVGGQYILGPVFQPSVFGVFLLLSISMFLKKKYTYSLILGVLTIYLHPTYLLPFLMLNISYIYIMYSRSDHKRTALGSCLLIFLLSIPVLYYLVNWLGSAPSDIKEKAMEILYNFRIPHHANPRIWFNIESVYKSILVIQAMIIVRRKKVFIIMTFIIAIAFILSFIQVITGSKILALMFPWRMSVLLVPLSSAVILVYLYDKISYLFRLKIKTYAISIIRLIVALILAGIIVTSGIITKNKTFKTFRLRKEVSMIKFVKENKKELQVYLIPPELSDFRLSSGAPIFVDSKNHPFSSHALVKWYERLTLAKELYQTNDISGQIIVDFMHKYNLTHIVVENDMEFANDPRLGKIYQDDHYKIFNLKDDI